MRGATRPVLLQIAAKVRALRLAKGLTQEQLAERADYAVRFVQFVEHGSRNLTIDSLVALADALEVKAGDLLPHTPHLRPPASKRRLPRS